jgi:tRNA (adenine37-N6)-methyltransferase
MEPFAFTPIGIIRTPFIDKFGTPRQGRMVPAAQARVEFVDSAPAELWLRGLEGFSHCWLIGVFHEHMHEPAPPLVHPPRMGGGAVGVFATRSPHRPNPVALTLAEIVGVEGRTLHVAGIDLLDGTPILDIKPFLPEADRADEARSGWVDAHPWPGLPVRITDSATARLDRIYELSPPPVPRDQFERLMVETLAIDPRAVADRAKIIEDGQPRRFWLRLYDVDVGFWYQGAAIIIEELRFALRSPLYERFESGNSLQDD